MTTPLDPQALKELAAGYVLGDLSSEEAEQFHQLLAQMPALRAEVEALQETLDMMPYALPEQRPHEDVRSRILSATQADFDSAWPASADPTAQSWTSKEAVPSMSPSMSPAPQPIQATTGRTTTRQTALRKKLPWRLGGVAVGAMLALGLGWFHWNSSRFSPFKFAQQQPSLEDLTGSSPETLLSDAEEQIEEQQMVEAPQIDEVWSGFHQLLSDHRNSLRNPAGPADFVVARVSDIPAQLEGFQPTLATLPVLPAAEGKLLGGSDCQFDKTRGLRLSYQVTLDQVTPEQVTPETQNSQIVSVYQLDLNGEQFPQFQSSYITQRQPDGTGVILWREDDYLYALVAELPLAELNKLAYSMGHI